MNTVVTSRQALLAASREIAARDGMQAVNMRAVASACGVAVGSVYNYFPSKADLMAAAVESIWEDIFHDVGCRREFDSFLGCVDWMFDCIQRGTKVYPAFFAAHAAAFGSGDVAKGRETMGRYIAHIKEGMLQALAQDGRVSQSAFDADFTREMFVDFVFSNFLPLLRSGDCRVLKQVIARIIYPR